MQYADLIVFRGEDYHLIPGSDGFYIGKNATIIERHKTTKQFQITTKFYSQDMRSKVRVKIGGKRKERFVDQLMVRMFLSPDKEDKTYKISYKDRDHRNHKLENLHIMEDDHVAESNDDGQAGQGSREKTDRERRLSRIVQLGR